MKRREPRNLSEELQQGRQFACVEQEAYLSVVRTAALLSRKVDQLLKSHGVTQTQYNALRILRGAGAKGMCRNEVAARLVAAAPDVTRLLDRMEAAGWIERRRHREDRREVAAVVTAMGRRVADRLEKPLEELHRQQFKGMGRAELRRMVDLLAEARAKGRE